MVINRACVAGSWSVINYHMLKKNVTITTMSNRLMALETRAVEFDKLRIVP